MFRHPHYLEVPGDTQWHRVTTGPHRHLWFQPIEARCTSAAWWHAACEFMLGYDCDCLRSGHDCGRMCLEPSSPARVVSHISVDDLKEPPCRRHIFPETRKIDRFEPGSTTSTRRRANSGSHPSAVSARRCITRTGGRGTPSRPTGRGSIETLFDALPGLFLISCTQRSATPPRAVALLECDEGEP